MVCIIDSIRAILPVGLGGVTIPSVLVAASDVGPLASVGPDVPITVSGFGVSANGELKIDRWLVVDGDDDS